MDLLNKWKENINNNRKLYGFITIACIVILFVIVTVVFLKKDQLLPPVLGNQPVPPSPIPTPTPTPVPGLPGQVNNLGLRFESL